MFHLNLSRAGSRMATNIFCASILITSSITVYATPRDEKNLQSLFTMAEVEAPSMIQCGLSGNAEVMVDSVVFLEFAYQRLNRSFSLSEPPIEQQLRKRISHVCNLIGCNDASRASEATCSLVRKGAPTTMGMFSRAVDDAKIRLQKNGSSPKESVTSKPTMTCPLSPQQYQDAYRKTLKADDLLCMMESAKRELGL